MERITKKYIDDLLDEIDARARAAEEAKAAKAKKAAASRRRPKARSAPNAGTRGEKPTAPRK